MKKELSKLRKNYNTGELNENNLNLNPFKQFDLWFSEALIKEPFEPNAMVLSTSDKENRPSSRVVLLKGYSDKDFLFFTNYKSRKAEAISANSKVALLFYWPKLQRQIRIEGKVKKTTQMVSEEYFNSRPFESRVGAVVSNQSQENKNYSQFIQLFEKTLKEKEIKRPKHWGGYIVIPTCFEFWQGRPNRMHDRFQYLLENRKWRIIRLYP